jgi:pimeloyl-ACP methyl ester carboxylesterase
VEPPSGRRAIVLLGVSVLLLVEAACDREQELRTEALAASQAITIDTGDVELAGRLFGPERSTTGVILAHMLPADQSAWFETAAALGERGYRVLTFNFRGYCPGGDAGCSRGDKDVNAADDDLRSALDYLRDLGVDRVGFVGASMGGTAALVVASDEGSPVDAVVTLSAPRLIGDLAVQPEALAGLTAAKLFVAGTGDVTAAQAAEAFYNGSQQPKRYELVTTDDHGTDLLTGNQGSRVESLIEGWLDAHLPQQGAAA